MRLQESFLLLKSRWISISSRQKIGVASLVFILLALPLSVGAVLTRQYLGSRASFPVTPPITGPTSLPTTTATSSSSPIPSITPRPTSTATTGPTIRPTPVNNSINWKTENVILSASNFYINIDGKNLFLSNPQAVVHSDYGRKDYTTIEATWQENNVEMRLFIYFNTDTNGNWNAYEIRTYNGQRDANWLYYYGLPSRPIGTPFIQTNVNLFSKDGRGVIHFENLYLLPFTMSALPCNHACTTTLNNNMIQCDQGLSCLNTSDNSVTSCRNPKCPNSSNCVCATPQTTNSPTPTPIANRNPVISTSVLKIARINKSYSVTISGYDLDKNNILSLNSTGFPKEIIKRNCVSGISENKTTISCIYSGIPKSTGIYPVKITLRDNNGGVRVKTLYFLALP